jgi:hypothetical protein
MMAKPGNQEIRTAMVARGISGKPADLLTEKFSEAFDKIEARGGADAVGVSIAAKIEAARKRLARKDQTISDLACDRAAARRPRCLRERW